MSDPEKEKIESLFHTAKSLPEAQREAYLSKACENLPDLKKVVMELLKASTDGDALFADVDADPANSDDHAQTMVDESSSSEGVGSMVDRYKLLENIGEGGFGSVWAAEQKQPVRRRVALKIIKLGMDTKQVVARFEAERQALALMDHPNIAKVLDAGATDSGRPYFVMELVKGIPITEYCEREKLDVTARLHLFTRVCHAIQHAHQKGIIHRDIKPSNIMVTLHDGEPVPKVIDFGIAKATQQELTERTLYTQYSQFIGTPAYMSPEQAEMSGLDIDTRSDIYSLGVLLYELLAGSTPFDSRELMQSGMDEMRRIIREQEPVRPSTKLTQAQSASVQGGRKVSVPASSSIDKDLDWIVMKCLEKDRARRYATAMGLAVDINRHLKDEPVRARPPSAAYKFQKMWRRRKVAITTAATIVISLAAGMTVSVWQAYEKTVESKKRAEAIVETGKALKSAEASRTDAQNSEKIARLNLYAADIKAVSQHIAQGNLGTSKTLLEGHIPEPGKEDLRGWEWRYFWDETKGDHLFRLPQEHKYIVRKVRFSPDGRHLVSFGAGSGEMILWDRIERKLERRLPDPPSKILDFEIGPDGSVIGIRFDNKQLELWKADLSKKIAVYPGEESVERFKFSPTGEIYLNDTDDLMLAWDWKSETQPRVLFSGIESILLDLTEDGRLLIDQGPTWMIWDVTKGEEIERLQIPVGAEPRPLDFDGGWRLVPPSSSVRAIYVRYLNTPEAVDAKFEPVGDYFKGKFGTGNSQIALSREHNLLATVSYNHNVNLWDLTDLEEKAELFGHQSEVWSVDISPDGRYLATGGQDREVLLWSTDHSMDNRGIPGIFGAAGAAFSPDGRHVALLAKRNDQDGAQIRILNLEGPSESASLPQAMPLRYSADGTQLVVLTTNSIERYDVATGSRKKRLPLGFERGGDSESLSRYVVCAGDLAAIKDKDGGLKVVDIHDGSLQFTLPKGGGQRMMALSNDGGRLAVSTLLDGRSRIEIWDLEKQNRIKELTGQFSHYREIYHLAFSPDDTLLASWSIDSTLGIWTVATGELRWVLRGHKRGASGGGFSPDGKTLVSTNSDRMMKLWNVETGREIASFDLPGSAGNASFSPDGRFLIAYGWAMGNCSIWEAPSMQKIRDDDPRQLELSVRQKR